jgi:predicted esterase
MKRSTLIPLLLAGLLFTLCEREKEDDAIHKMAMVRGYQNWYIETFRCGLFVPEDYTSSKPYPLIIFLHGHTDTTTWDLAWYNEPITSNDPCIVLTPKCPVEEIYGWGDSFDPRTSPMMAKTYEMISMAEQAFNLDKNRYYIYGSSMGGHGTYGVIRKNPELFAAGYVECGKGNIEMAPILADIPFWIFHGSEDPVVPVQPARDLYQAVLDYGGYQIRYTEYEGVAHNAWDYTRNETTIPSWLLAQRKGSVHNPPAPVNGFTCELNDDQFVHLQWEIPEKTTPPSDDNIWYCRIYRDGHVIREVYNDTNTFVDTSVVAHASYTYAIVAVNYFFKESAMSNGIEVEVNE